MSAARTTATVMTTALLALIVTGCGGGPSAAKKSVTGRLPGVGRPTILLGDMNTPEQFVIGQLYGSALTREGYTVELDRNIGTASVRSAALGSGTLDVYPEYLGVWDSQVAGLTRRFSTLSSAYTAGLRYAHRLHLVLLKPTQFSDTGGLAVLSSYAIAHHISTIANLRRVEGQLTIGAPLDFSAIPPGLPAIDHAYNLRPHVIAPVNIGLQYIELRLDQIQAAYVFTSDGQLSQQAYRLLRDPLHEFGFGNVVAVISDSAIKAEGPAMVATINRVDALLTTSAMRGLNAEVDLGHHAPQTVANEFLQGNGLLAPTVWPTTVTSTTTTATVLTAPTQTTTRSSRSHRHRAAKARAH
jgi:osmoprotectant transport system substrate-binding protein